MEKKQDSIMSKILSKMPMIVVAVLAITFIILSNMQNQINEKKLDEEQTNTEVNTTNTIVENN